MLFYFFVFIGLCINIAEASINNDTILPCLGSPKTTIRKTLKPRTDRRNSYSQEEINKLNTPPPIDTKIRSNSSTSQTSIAEIVNIEKMSNPNTNQRSYIFEKPPSEKLNTESFDFIAKQEACNPNKTRIESLIVFSVEHISIQLGQCKGSLDIIDAALNGKTPAQQKHMTNHFMDIMYYFKERRLGGTDDPIYLKVSDKQALAFLKSASRLFCLKDIEQANVKKRFQDLNHKNTNVNAAYLLYQIITHYYETKPESTTINQMNSRLIDVTKSIINYFYFSGKINDLTLRQSSNPIKSELDKKYQQKVIKKHNKNIIDYYIKIVINLDLVHRDDDQFYMDPGFKEMLLNGLDMKEEYFLFLCNAGSRF